MESDQSPSRSTFAEAADEAAEVQRWGTMNVHAGRVFTPNTPVDEKSLFAGRAAQVDTIIDVINQKGQHAIVYGERGVGKTSLMNVLKSFLDVPESIIAPRVNCDSSDTYKSVWQKAFDLVEVSKMQSGIGFTAEDSASAITSQELLGENVSPNSVLRALRTLSQTTTPIFIIDEFDRLGQEPRRAFADTIKSLSDNAIRATVIMVGVADSVDQLISEHQSVERALVQIQMPRMSVEEIKQIIQLGVNQLGMSVTPGALKQISRLAQGLPHYAHLLGLHAAREAISSRSLEIGTPAVQSAIEKSIRGANQSIRTSYETAVRSARKDNLFADVLLACALAETTDLGYFAAQDVREPMRRITGKSYEIPSFAQHLNDFCDNKRGPILQKIGTKRLYRYRFINPLLQPFVIMHGLQGDRISSSALD